MIKISVVIPVFNSQAKICSVIESVINQITPVYEIIIINDCSSDGTRSVLEEYVLINKTYNLKLINLDKNRGVSYCRNLGWNLATGNYIAFMDSDDYWNLNKITIMVDIIGRFNPDLLGHKYNDRNIFLKKEYLINDELLSEINFYNLLLRNLFQTSCVLIKIDIIDRFNETISHSEDYELFLRLSAKKKKIYYYNEELTYLGRPQLSKGGLSEKKMKMRIGEIKAYRSALQIRKISYLIPLMTLISMLKYLSKTFR